MLLPLLSQEMAAHSQQNFETALKYFNIRQGVDCYYVLLPLEPTAREAILEEPVLLALLAVVRKPRHPGAHLLSLNTIVKCVTNNAAARAIISLEGHSLMAQLLSSPEGQHRGDLTLACLRGLASLAVYMGSDKGQLRSCGGLSLMIQSLVREKGNTALRLYALKGVAAACANSVAANDVLQVADVLLIVCRILMGCIGQPGKLKEQGMDGATFQAASMLNNLALYSPSRPVLLQAGVLLAASAQLPCLTAWHSAASAQAGVLLAASAQAGVLLAASAQAGVLLAALAQAGVLLAALAQVAWCLKEESSPSGSDGLQPLDTIGIECCELMCKLAADVSCRSAVLLHCLDSLVSAVSSTVSLNLPSQRQGFSTCACVTLALLANSGPSCAKIGAAGIIPPLVSIVGASTALLPLTKAGIITLKVLVLSRAVSLSKDQVLVLIRAASLSKDQVLVLSRAVSLSKEQLLVLSRAVSLSKEQVGTLLPGLRRLMALINQTWSFLSKDQVLVLSRAISLSKDQVLVLSRAVSLSKDHVTTLLPGLRHLMAIIPDNYNSMSSETDEIWPLLMALGVDPISFQQEAKRAAPPAIASAPSASQRSGDLGVAAPATPDKTERAYSGGQHSNEDSKNVKELRVKYEDMKVDLSTANSRLKLGDEDVGRLKAEVHESKTQVVEQLTRTRRLLDAIEQLKAKHVVVEQLTRTRRLLDTIEQLKVKHVTDMAVARADDMREIAAGVDRLANMTAARDELQYQIDKESFRKAQILADIKQEAVRWALDQDEDEKKEVEEKLAAVDEKKEVEEKLAAVIAEAETLSTELEQLRVHVAHEEALRESVSEGIKKAALQWAYDLTEAQKQAAPSRPQQCRAVLKEARQARTTAEAVAETIQAECSVLAETPGQVAEKEELKNQLEDAVRFAAQLRSSVSELEAQAGARKEVEEDSVTVAAQMKLQHSGQVAQLGSRLRMEGPWRMALACMRCTEKLPQHDRVSQLGSRVSELEGALEDALAVAAQMKLQHSGEVAHLGSRVSELEAALAAARKEVEADAVKFASHRMEVTQLRSRVPKLEEALAAARKEVEAAAKETSSSRKDGLSSSDLKVVPKGLAMLYLTNQQWQTNTAESKWQQTIYAGRLAIAIENKEAQLL
eukprot:gene25234-10880_t